MNLPTFFFPALQPILLRLDPERAHHLTLTLLRLWQPIIQQAAPAILRCRLFNLDLPTPIGLAAGFDKNGIAADKILALGFGFAEVGTITPAPQSGNLRPRLFRRAKDEAIINQMGFNNQGLNAFIARYSQYKKNKIGAIGINIGANAQRADRIADYITCVERLEMMKHQPDYITINVSSPNTENLRQLENVNQLAQLLDRIKSSLPLFVKLSPDMEDSAYNDIAQLAMEKKKEKKIERADRRQYHDQA